MSTRSGLALARISRRCGVGSTTVHERYVQYVTNPQRPSATVNIELGNQIFFATGHVQCFLRKAWSTMQRTDAAVGSIRRPDPTARALAHWQACRWGPPQRRQHLVQGGEQQLSILRREYQRRVCSGSALYPVARISISRRPAQWSLRHSAVDAVGHPADAGRGWPCRAARHRILADPPHRVPVLPDRGPGAAHQLGDDPAAAAADRPRLGSAARGEVVCRALAAKVPGICPKFADDFSVKSADNAPDPACRCFP